MAVQGNFQPGQFPSKLYPTWDGFEAHFRATATVNDWGNDDARNMLAYCLNGYALEEYLALPGGVRAGNMDPLLLALRNRVAEDVNPRIARTKFRGAAQQYGENLLDFARRIKKLAASSYHGMDAAVIDLAAREQFVEGLVDQDVRYEILKTDPATFDETVLLARRLESISPDAQRAKTRRLPPNQQVRLVENNEECAALGFERPPRTEGLDETLKNLNFSLTAINNTLSRFEGSMRTGFSSLDSRISGIGFANNRGGGFASKTPRDTREVRCWKCGELGHYASSCTAKNASDQGN